MGNSSSQPTYKRQRFLLDFIRHLPGGARSTDLQKLVFLYTMKDQSDFYEFVPYMYGPYSFQLAEDVNTLRNNGFLMTIGTKIRAKDEIEDANPYNVPIERGDSLIRKAYKEYPYYAINSEIISRIFTEKEKKNYQVEKESYFKDEQKLFTIGYEGKSIESFCNTLIQNGIRTLCDVRKNPVSRKFGFSKKKLEHIIKTIGINYIHIPELGIESDKRIALNSMADYDALFSEYKANLPSMKQKIDSIYNILSDHNRIALMCYEKDPRMCHRHVIRDYLVTTYGIMSGDL